MSRQFALTYPIELCNRMGTSARYQAEDFVVRQGLISGLTTILPTNCFLPRSTGWELSNVPSPVHEQ